MRAPHSIAPARSPRWPPFTRLVCAWGLVLASLVGAGACGRPSQAPARGAEGQDAASVPASAERGGTTTGGGPARIVSLTPAACALVGALGRGDRLVGATAHCEVPGAPHNLDIRPNLERVVALRPDLVVIGAYPFNRSDIAKLAAAGLPVLAVPLTTLDDLRGALDRLGARLEATEAARRLRAALDGALSEARALAAADAGARPRVLLVYEVADGYVYTSGGGDHLEPLLTACGAVNVAAPGPLTARLSIERVLALGPEVLVHTAPTRALPDSAAALAYWRRVAPSIPAVKTGRVHVWPDGSLAQPGPALARAVVRLARLLHPDAAPAGAP